MRLSFLRFVATVFAVGVLLPINAQAIIRTINFEATDLSIEGAGDPFSVIDSSFSSNDADKRILRGSFSFDTTVTPFFTQNSPAFAQTISPYINFLVDVGSVTLNGSAASVANDRILVRDGLNSNNTHLVFVTSVTDQSLSAGTLDFIRLSLLSSSLTNPFDTTAVPSLLELNSPIFVNRLFDIGVKDVNGNLSRAVYSTVTFSEELSTVPVPAALPLFGTGLALMGFIGWRRKRKLAATA